MNKLKLSPITLIFISIISLYIQPIHAEEQSNDKNTYLEVARNQLSTAFDKYNDGDISGAKKSLSKASGWLYKAVAHSTYDKVKIEAEKLAAEIDAFRQTLSHSSEQNDMVRFWHQATSLITRESEHIIHSYIKSSNENKLLKQLLDAKMHFFIADHDLFVSHDLKNAIKELNNSLKYLEHADSTARPELETRINNLINNIKALVSRTESNKESWKDDKVIDSLSKAIKNVTDAESSATPSIKLRLKSIEQNIYQLKLDMQKTNIKSKYDSIMADLILAIKNI